MTSSEAAPYRSRFRRVPEVVGKRGRSGWARMTSGFFQAVQMTVAAVGAYVIAERLLGHQGPIFAATAVTSSTVPSQETMTAPPAWRAISPVSRVTVRLPYWKLLVTFATS